MKGMKTICLPAKVICLVTLGPFVEIGSFAT
jgi:hypothetical protein